MDQAITLVGRHATSGCDTWNSVGRFFTALPIIYQAAHKRTAQRLIGYKSLIGERPTLIEEVSTSAEPQIVMRLEGHPLPRPRGPINGGVTP